MLSSVLFLPDLDDRSGRIAPPLEVFKARLDGALGSLGCYWIGRWVALSAVVGGLELHDPWGPFQPKLFYGCNTAPGRERGMVQGCCRGQWPRWCHLLPHIWVMQLGVWLITSGQMRKSNFTPGNDGHANN